MLETGRLHGCAESHALAVGAVVALVHKAGIPLRVVTCALRHAGADLPNSAYCRLDRLFYSLDAAVNGRADRCIGCQRLERPLAIRMTASTIRPKSTRTRVTGSRMTARRSSSTMPIAGGRAQ